MRRLGSVILVYTERQKEELLLTGRARVWSPLRTRSTGAPTSWRPHRSRDGHPYSARLVASKKPRLLVEAFLLAASADLPADVRLVLAGEGPERAPIESLCNGHVHGDRVALLGHISPVEMKSRYARAFVSVAPGSVGLSIVQTLSFGVPMIYARDQQHGPEMEAAIDGFNSQAVPADNPDALASAIVDFARERAAWNERRGGIADDCRTRYSADLMADRILEAAQ